MAWRAPSSWSSKSASRRSVTKRPSERDHGDVEAHHSDVRPEGEAGGVWPGRAAGRERGGREQRRRGAAPPHGALRNRRRATTPAGRRRSPPALPRPRRRGERASVDVDDPLQQLHHDVRARRRRGLGVTTSARLRSRYRWTPGAPRVDAVPLVAHADPGLEAAGVERLAELQDHAASARGGARRARGRRRSGCGEARTLPRPGIGERARVGVARRGSTPRAAIRTTPPAVLGTPSTSTIAFRVGGGARGPTARRGRRARSPRPRSSRP